MSHSETPVETATSNSSTGLISGWMVHLLPVVGIAILAFLFGMITAIKQTPPFHAVRDAWLAYCSLNAEEGIIADPWPPHMWYPADGPERGVLHSDPERVQGDYTLFTAGNACTATLIDLEGNEVHRWEAPFWSVLPHSTRVPAWVPERFIVMRRALAYPNGDLLALYETIANTPSGCGLAKLDVDGNVLWTYDDYAHHDVDVGPDGKIYVLVHQLRRLGSADKELKPLTDLPLVEDYLAILSPEGKELRRISLLDSLVASPYYRPMLTHVDRYGDITHNNTVHVVGEGFASHYPEVSPGDLLVCLRNLNLVTVVSPESGNIVWATNGPWEHPHDPDPLEDGNIMIFNNFVSHGTNHGSEVVEYNPASHQIAWEYTGEQTRHLRSDTRGCQQLLRGGHVFITEGDHGRLLEVDRVGNIVWEFVHPLRGGANQELVPLVCSGRRYWAEELPFLGQATKGGSEKAPTGNVASLNH